MDVSRLRLFFAIALLFLVGFLVFTTVHKDTVLKNSGIVVDATIDEIEMHSVQQGRTGMLETKPYNILYYSFYAYDDIDKKKILFRNTFYVPVDKYGRLEMPLSARVKYEPQNPDKSTIVWLSGIGDIPIDDMVP